MRGRRQLVIVGAGGFGREVLEWARQSPEHGSHWDLKGFVDDNADALRDFSVGAEVLGGIRDYHLAEHDILLCAIGRPALRRQVHELFAERGAEFLTLVHPTAVVAKSARLGAGVIVCPFALVSVDAVIGDGSAIYYHSSIDHDARVGRYCQVSAHCDVTGGARLGEEVFLGSHASVLPWITVGDRAVIGAGAIVNRPVHAGVTVTGVPAKART